MRASIINQYPNQTLTVSHLGALLTDFSRLTNAQLRALTAFVSETGLQMLVPQLRRFLDRRHGLYWIVGVDLGGTGREALELLYKLKREYNDQVDVRVFSTADNKSIFHPKVYWFDANDQKVVIVGSANATVGGLMNNFEVSVQLDLRPVIDEDVIEELEFLWMSYSSPLPPLRSENLLEINQSLIARLNHDHPPTDGSPNQLHPLHGLVRTPLRRNSLQSPRRGAVQPSSRGPRSARVRRELLMDILQETRRTQVQIPVEALNSFFAGSDTVRLRQTRKGTVVKEDMRPIIHLGNNTHRIEIDAKRSEER